MIVGVVSSLKWFYIRGRWLIYFRDQTTFQAMCLQSGVHCKDSLFKSHTLYSHLWPSFGNWDCQSVSVEKFHLHDLLLTSLILQCFLEIHWFCQFCHKKGRHKERVLKFPLPKVHGPSKHGINSVGNGGCTFPGL